MHAFIHFCVHSPDILSPFRVPGTVLGIVMRDFFENILKL